MMRTFALRRNPSRSKPAAARAVLPVLERLERRALMSAPAVKLAPKLSPTGSAELPPGTIGYDPSLTPNDVTAPPNPDQLLTQADVNALLERAAAAVNRNDAIIAVVDRNGTILGVRVESGVSPLITQNTTNKVFAIDGAVSLAHTAPISPMVEGPSLRARSRRSARRP